MHDMARSGGLFSWPGENAPNIPPRSLCVLGAPTDKGNAISRGAALAPAAIRHQSLICKAPCLIGTDWGDVEDHAEDLGTYLDALGERVGTILQQNLCPLILGGDHAITYAPVSKIIEQEEICLIWFDAHTDFSPWHGPDCHTHKQILRRLSGLQGIRNIVQVGHRGITIGDERNLGASSQVITTRAAEALDKATFLNLIPQNHACYISIDIDVIDPQWVPGTSAPVPDGLGPKTLSRMLSWIIRNHTVAALDLVEVNPRQDMGSSSSQIAAGLLRDIAQCWDSQILKQSESKYLA